MSAILSEVRAGSGPSCDWLQQSRTSHKIGPVLPFPHASSAAALQPITLCGVALSSHTGTTPQNSCGFALAWRAAVTVAYVCDGNKAVPCQA